MKMIKMIKLSASVIGIVGVLGISSNIVSCSHSKGGPDDNNKPTWTDFKISASGASILAIITNAVPTVSSWDLSNDDDFNFVSRPLANEQDQTLTAIISSTINNDQATFVIAYNNKAYADKLWRCSVQPPNKQVGWNAFKKVALNSITTTDLLAQARISKDWNSFKWTYGSASQVKWNQNDVAEWDVSGNLGDQDSYKGMQGKPQVNDKDYTISAIISKKGCSGNYDSDPIKAIITYSNGVKYNIKNWKFSQTEQLQSYEKVTKLFTEQVALVINSDDKNKTSKWATFIQNDWMTFGDDAKGNNHSNDNNIDEVLKRAQPKAYYPYLNGYVPKFNSKQVTLDPIKDPTQIEMKIIFDFQYWKRLDPPPFKYQLSLYFRYVFAKGHDQTGGGTAFSYTWAGDVTKNKDIA